MDLYERDKVSAPIIEDFNGQTIDGAVNGGSTTILENQAERYAVPPMGVEPSSVNTGGAPSYIPAPIHPQHPQQNYGMQPTYQQPQPAPYDPSIPISELFELDDKFVIMLDMPGLDKSTIDIKYDHPSILINAVRPDAIENMKEKYGESLLQNSKRKYYGKLSAGFNINKNIETVEAEYTDGILIITAIFKQKGEISIKLK